MNNEKYVALDVHKASISIGVRNSHGKLVGRSVIETKAQTIKDYVRGLSGTIHLTFEEGTQAAWLYDLLSPYVARCVVCNPRHNHLLKEGNKSDAIDVEKLSELLYLGRLKPVYHGGRGTRTLKELVRSYEAVLKDQSRVKNRLKAIFRGRGISYRGDEVYDLKERSKWLVKLNEEGVRRRAEQLYEQLGQLAEWVSKARLEMVKESRKHPVRKVLMSVPAIGEISAAELIAIVDTPHRFRTKRQFWSYCGLAVVRHSSADYEVVDGALRRRQRPGPTRGLNRNCNHQLKKIFKTAALTTSHEGPFRPTYERLIARGLKPELAQVTLARKIATVTLALWKKGEQFDSQKLTSVT